MSAKFRFEAFIFDMDGLMFDTERLGLEGYRHAAHQHGYNLENGAFHDIIGRTASDAKRLLHEKFGSDFPVEKIREARRRYVAEILNVSGMPIKSGLMELLEYLKKKKVLLAIASSSSRRGVERNLKNAGIINNFKVIVCGDEITHGKPNPEIFLKTAEKLSKEPSTCVVLEDSLLGLEAAHAAGMIPIMIPDMQHPTDVIRRMAYRIFPSLHDVRAYLESEDRS
ncbi:MAG: hypothetical protein A3A26_01675 [Candidatus Zambryskibacteria bacterium RIFCSPLOWO2_01_FULL_47_14]|uniref:HAD family phosphatase n=1 Tax=Candidatus Zambryskibacteria bacterium RIFCSPLOWO2_01_FULL_47_14 TaxID=1802763 RepID=A0A1G2U8H5_9BACT|nr:MAG: hypothetical protein A3A26_01675 [Candidatus Zambryskibacteria bacterium RIFCSPLOWO2_01_FULL_47_14]